MSRLTLLEKELAKVKKELAKYRAFVDEVSRPTDLYLRELARECASGNWQALKDHNKRVSGQLSNHRKRIINDSQTIKT